VAHQQQLVLQFPELLLVVLTGMLAIRHNQPNLPVM
jgi:hypothetical protein